MGSVPPSPRRRATRVLLVLSGLAACDHPAASTTRDTPPASSSVPAPAVSVTPSALVTPAPVAPAPVASASASAVASASEPPPEPPKVSSGCYEQAPQPFLVRGSYYPAREHREDHARAIEYRARTYGEIPKLTPRGLNAHEPQFDTQTVPFFGQTVQLHRKILPALRCVEREITRTCKAAYHVEALAGWRPNNTYHQGEISNHLFGIAIDIDPHRNPCCHCIEPWNNHPRCGNHKASAYEHTSLPRCWIDTFERFGFYWLGHDELEDTMHFEFLGDPDRIVPPPVKKKK